MKALAYVACVALVVGFIAVGCGKKEEASQGAKAPGKNAPAAAAKEQKIRPVMGGSIDKNIFVEYLGETAGHEHTHGDFSAVSLIVPMGIATLSLVAVTVFLGLFRRWSPKLMLKWHKRSGVLALLAGAIHAALVLLAH